MKDLKLKKYLPRSFFGRALLIIILPIIFLEAIIGSPEQKCYATDLADKAQIRFSTGP